MPHTRNATSAIPVGGHTVVTCLVVNASDNPNRAAAKYATPTTPIRSASR
jgi:hypothetical protein